MFYPIRIFLVSYCAVRSLNKLKWYMKTVKHRQAATLYYVWSYSLVHIRHKSHLLSLRPCASGEDRLFVWNKLFARVQCINVIKSKKQEHIKIGLDNLQYKDVEGRRKVRASN